jgi:hypothetical protein
MTITSVYVEYGAETQNSQKVFFLNPYNFVTNISLLFVFYAFSKLKKTLTDYRELVFTYNAIVFVCISVTLFNDNNNLIGSALYNEQLRMKC